MMTSVGWIEMLRREETLGARGMSRFLLLTGMCAAATPCHSLPRPSPRGRTLKKRRNGTISRTLVSLGGGVQAELSGHGDQELFHDFRPETAAATSCENNEDFVCVRVTNHVRPRVETTDMRVMDGGCR
jgi:hypothetical protein